MRQAMLGAVVVMLVGLLIMVRAVRDVSADRVAGAAYT